MGEATGTGAGARLRVLAAAHRSAAFTIIWAALVGADPEGWVFGALAIPAALWLSLRLLPPGRPARPARVLAMVPGFLARSVSGGLDVARRAFDPRLPLRPGWLIHDVKLTPGGRVALGAELSLMPGTLVAGSDGQSLLVHVLDTGVNHKSALVTEEARLAAIMGQVEE